MWMNTIYLCAQPFIDLDVQRHSEDETSSSILRVVCTTSFDSFASYLRSTVNSN